jgi:protein-histidine pros-kinase
MFRSLSARLLATLTIGLAAIQIISFIAFMTFRAQEAKERRTRFLGADVSFVYELLKSMPAAQRPEWVMRLNQGYHYRYSLEPAAPEEPEVAFQDERVAEVAAILKATLPAEAKLSFRLPAELTPEIRDNAWQVVLSLDQKQSLVLHLFDTFTMLSTGALLVYLAVVLLAVTPFVWWAVHLTTRRIDRMLGTIEQFGRNLNSPPVPESGPGELRRAARAVNAMRERILKHIEERTQILAAIAHDLQTPLTRLRLRAEALETGAPRDRIIADVEYMASLVTEGLDYAHSEHLREANSVIEVNHWLEGMVDDAQDAGAVCVLNGQALAPYTGALRALTRAMQNLIDNALKFGTEAEVRIEDSSERLTVRVLDNGPGLSDALMVKVFDPFFRAESSRNRATGGSGLGLSIARNIVRAHGGDIRLKNRAEGGLEVIVELPRRGA